jgi:hypothetical protein
MATITTATTTTPTAVTQTVTTSWLKHHERIVIVALVLLAGCWGYGRYAGIAASRAETRATVAEQALSAQQSQNSQNAAQIATLTQQYQQLTQALTVQNASLAASLAARQKAQAAAVATDATLAPADLATRLETLGQAPVGSVTVSGNEIAMTQLGAVAITQTLEAIAPLQANLRDTTATLQTAEATQAKADALIADQTKQIAGLNLAAVDADKVCKAQVAEVKATSRKNSLKWFVRGTVIGFIGGLLVH